MEYYLVIIININIVIIKNKVRTKPLAGAREPTKSNYAF